MEASDDGAITANEKLLEVPTDVALFAFNVSHRGKCCVEGVLVVAVDIDLLGEREGDAISRGAERGDFF